MNQIMKCKNCGAELDIRKASGGVVECEYCFSKTTVPKPEIPPAALQYLHDGDSALYIGDFDNAYSYYLKAAELSRNEPEAYFGMALAHFRVRYIFDEVNNHLQPIVGKISPDLFTESKNYIKVMKCASAQQKAIYEQKAKEIDYIREEFLKAEKRGLDYDCFICVKVTDSDTGGRTADYKLADDIYFALKHKGYKPFFSETELSGKAGADYEAMILFALIKSKCMLIVCSDEEYLHTKWVKNEYTRFLHLVNDEEKACDSLTIVYNKRPIERLPGRNGKIQGIDISRFDSSEAIFNFVERHVRGANAPKRPEILNRRTEEEPEVEQPKQEEKPKEQYSDIEKDEQPTKTYSFEEIQRAKKAYDVGMKYFNKKKYEKAAESLKEAAELGHAGAQYQIGRLYDNGKGVDKNYRLAAKWYLKAACQGNTDAQTNLGECYQRGEGVPQDYGRAAAWYAQAAEQGDMIAQTNLGNCFARGTGVRQDHVKAFEWYSKAAEQGEPMAQYNIGLSYYYGKGVPKDYGLAFKMFEKAAGYPKQLAQAQFMQAECYELGRGVEQNDIYAQIYYERAASQGIPEAMYRAGKMYLKREYPDYSGAAKWFDKAIKNGVTAARKELEYCRQQLNR